MLNLHVCEVLESLILHVIKLDLYLYVAGNTAGILSAEISRKLSGESNGINFF